MNIVFAILESLQVASFSIGRGGSLENFAIDCIEFLLELFDAIVYCLLDYYFSLLR